MRGLSSFGGGVGTQEPPEPLDAFIQFLGGPRIRDTNVMLSCRTEGYPRHHRDLLLSEQSARELGRRPLDVETWKQVESATRPDDAESWKRRQFPQKMVSPCSEHLSESVRLRLAVLETQRQAR